MPLCEAFFGRERRSGPHTLGEKLRVALYGWFSPWLLGIYNHAIIAGMTAQWRNGGCDSRVVQAALTVTSAYTPMAPTLVRAPFHRSGWIYEEKYDGRARRP